jgi:hypothetical protein
MADIVSTGKHGKGVGVVCKSHSLSLTQSTINECNLERSRESISDNLPRSKQMKNRSLLALVGLVISFALPAFAQQTDKPDPQLRQRLVEVIRKHDDAINRNDADAVAALYTEGRN